MHHFVGKPAVSFDLPGTDGRRHGLELYRGRWLLIVLHRHLA
jgi:peroxiredoxin